MLQAENLIWNLNGLIEGSTTVALAKYLAKGDNNLVRLGKFLESYLQLFDKVSSVKVILKLCNSLLVKLVEISEENSNMLSNPNFKTIVESVYITVNEINQNLRGNYEMCKNLDSDQFYTLFLELLIEICNFSTQLLNTEFLEKFNLGRNNSFGEASSMTGDQNIHFMMEPNDLLEKSNLQVFVEERVFPLIELLTLEQIQQFSDYLEALIHLIRAILDQYELIFDDLNFSNLGQPNFSQNRVDVDCMLASIDDKIERKPSILIHFLKIVLHINRTSFNDMVRLYCLDCFKLGIENSFYCIED